MFLVFVFLAAIAAFLGVAAVFPRLYGWLSNRLGPDDEADEYREFWDGTHWKNEQGGGDDLT